jgi:hypothetical protein
LNPYHDHRRVFPHQVAAAMVKQGGPSSGDGWEGQDRRWEQ